MCLLLVSINSHQSPDPHAVLSLNANPASLSENLFHVNFGVSLAFCSIPNANVYPK